MVFVITEQFTISCRLIGIWHLTSVQSIITLVDEYFFLKSSGIVISIVVLEGQILICPNLRYIKLSQVIKTRLTVDTETLKRCARCSSGRPCLSLHITAKYSSIGLKFLGLPSFLDGSPSDSS